MSAPPTMPDPTKISELINTQVSASIDLLNVQWAEAATTLGLPAPPTLPKFALPTLPTLPAGPTSMFLGQRTKTRAEETIKTPYTGAKVEEILA